MLIDRNRSCLLVIDVQERLLPAMAAAQGIVGNAVTLVRAATRLGVPVLASEQYRRGLGATVPALAAELPAACSIEKQHFSCLADPGFAERFRGLGRSQAVVTGIEAHVCVLQTALDLNAEGVHTFVVGDATGSRTEASLKAALARARAAGIEVVTTEMVVFEWLRRAGTPEFKELSALIK
jgi:nicotinamidase-related amidase